MIKSIGLLILSAVKKDSKTGDFVSDFYKNRPKANIPIHHDPNSDLLCPLVKIKRRLCFCQHHADNPTILTPLYLTFRQYWPLERTFLVLFSMLRLNLIPQYHGWKTNWHITFKSNISLAYPMGFNKKDLWSHPDRPQYYPKAYPIERPVYSIGRGYFGYGWWRTL